MGTWKRAKRTVEDAREDIERGRAADEVAKKRAEKTPPPGKATFAVLALLLVAGCTPAPHGPAPAARATCDEPQSWCQAGDR